MTDVKVGNEATYLGDGLYAEFDGYQFEVYASNGLSKTNRVFMEPSVVTSFFEYVARTRGELPKPEPAKFIDVYDETKFLDGNLS